MTRKTYTAVVTIIAEKKNGIIRISVNGSEPITFIGKLSEAIRSLS